METTKELQLTGNDFEKMIGEPLSAAVKSKIDGYGLKYRNSTEAEKEDCLKTIIGYLIKPNPVFAGEHRLDQWEQGWRENLDAIEGAPSLESILPLYFGKYDRLRMNQKFIRPLSKNFEYLSLGMILDWLFDKYAKDVDAMYEFGCGTGHHLFRAREFNKTATLWGLDWTRVSQDIIGRFASAGVDKKMKGHRFDYFNPDMNFDIEKNSVVYTVASLEQVGEKYDKFVDYLLKKKPKLVIHIEPIGELLDENVLIDYLSVEYFKKRNYLSGFLNHLKKLEGDKLLKIQMAKRTYVGSLFIEGYSVIVWSPGA